VLVTTLCCHLAVFPVLQFSRSPGKTYTCSYWVLRIMIKIDQPEDALNGKLKDRPIVACGKALHESTNRDQSTATKNLTGG
jgi:hypothetical protein